MPELPDVTVYCEAIARDLLDRRMAQIELRNAFLLRSVDPPPTAFEGRTLREVRRVGKRIALGFEDDHWLVIHLMIAGRLAWSDGTRTGRARSVLANFRFEHGTLTLTEAGSKRRASLHLARGREAWRDSDPGGLEVLDASLEAFRERLTLRNHTLKRALTDPTLFSGIGNAYSDEILHAARLSPVAQTQHLEPAQTAQLHVATREVLAAWTERLRAAAGTGFPARVSLN